MSLNVPWPNRDGTNPKTRPPATILALDPERIPLRLVRTNAAHCPIVKEHQSFEHLNEFWSYLLEWPVTSPVYLAAPGDSLDPLGVLDWLDEQGYKVERFPLASRLYARAHTLVPFNLPDTHHDAYVVATLAACRRNVPEAAHDLYHGLQHLKDELTHLETQVSLLVATLTDADPSAPGNYHICPF